MTLVMLPSVPSNGYSSRGDPEAAIGASGAEQMDGGFEGSGPDPEFSPLSHDFCSDTLPEAIQYDHQAALRAVV